MRLSVLKHLAWPVLLVGQVGWSVSALAEGMDPNDWLNRMAAAVQQTSYEGTVIRIRKGEAEALKVVHTISDGVVHEKVVSQEGDGLEIIRKGNAVHCILPDSRSVLVDEWDDQSTLFSTLPSSEVRFGSEYDVVLVREERIAGRQAVLVAIRPHDEYRYGHRIWLDTETAFPLQTQLIDPSGSAIEQVKFADIRLSPSIDPAMLAPSIDISTFRWVDQQPRHVGHKIDTEWRAAELPRGFRAVATHGETMPGGSDLTTHIVYSDGLANVSVFIAPAGDNLEEGALQVGESSSYSTVIEGYRVTAVGEVPAMTLEQIATTMMPR
jgi:sigma-E factor negative regulatory protein RseB